MPKRLHAHRSLYRLLCVSLPVRAGRSARVGCEDIPRAAGLQMMPLELAERNSGLASPLPRAMESVIVR